MVIFRVISIFKYISFTHVEIDVNVEENANITQFSMGDNVEVCAGDLQFLRGKIIAIADKMITMQSMHEMLTVEIIISHRF